METRTRNAWCFKTSAPQEFPGGLVVRIPGFHCRGPGSIPGLGTKTLQAVWPKKKKKKKETLAPRLINDEAPENSESFSTLTPIQALFIQITSHQTVNTKEFGTNKKTEQICIGRSGRKINKKKKKKKRDLKLWLEPEICFPPPDSLLWALPPLIVCFWKRCFVKARFFFIILCDSGCRLDHFLYPGSSFPSRKWTIKICCLPMSQR